MKVIVGKEYEDKATPVFSDSMEYVVFRPYWNVTPDIAAKEIFPKGDPSYLAANDMEFYDDHGRRAVRQRPGPKNALGLREVPLPERLQHLPARHAEPRAVQEGRARVQPRLHPRREAGGARAVGARLGRRTASSEAMQNGKDNQPVKLPKKIPVYIVYFTTYVSDGQLYFGNDLYDRDSKLIAEVESAATLSPETIQARDALRAMAKD